VKSASTSIYATKPHWEDPLAIMPVCWRDIDRQREAVLVHRDMDLDALDFLAAIEAAREAGRRRMTGAAVDDYSAGYKFVATGLPPCQNQAVEQPAPQAKPGPAGEQRVERAKRNVAEQSSGAPLHAAKADAPDCHDRPAQRRLRSGAGSPAAVRRHGREFRQYRIDEGVGIGECIPRGWRRLGRVEGGAHMLLIRLLLAMART
jgi:hypothetical protein